MDARDDWLQPTSSCVTCVTYDLPGLSMEEVFSESGKVRALLRTLLPLPALGFLACCC